MRKDTRTPIEKLNDELKIAERWVKIYASCGETEAAFDAKIEVSHIRQELNIIFARNDIKASSNNPFIFASIYNNN